MSYRIKGALGGDIAPCAPPAVAPEYTSTYGFAVKRTTPKVQESCNEVAYVQFWLLPFVIFVYNFMLGYIDLLTIHTKKLKTISLTIIF